jgi:hypothetical protein
LVLVFIPKRVYVVSAEIVVVREDWRCGPDFPLPGNGEPSKCDPESDSLCCSDSGWCGNTPDHCDCSECVNYRDGVVREDFPCGPDFPIPGPGHSECDPE